MADTNITCRSHPKGRTRPQTNGGVIERALISFYDFEKGQLLRQPVDLVYSPCRRKPKIIEFSFARGKNKTARFYLPLQIAEAEVVSLVSRWFEQLGIHDRAKAFTVHLEEERNHG
jgi:hypothetical protein